MVTFRKSLDARNAVARRVWLVGESANPKPTGQTRRVNRCTSMQLRRARCYDGQASAHRLAVFFSHSGSLNTQNEPPCATGLVSTAISPPHSGTAPP